MKKHTISTIFILILLPFLSLAQQKKIVELPIGSDIPYLDSKLMDVSGKEISISDVKGENGVLVIFSCNTCPYVKAWEPRYLKIAKRASEIGVGIILLNPNEAIRDKGESLDDMKKVAESMKYTFPYVIDKDHILADAFGAARTPHIYLFDKNKKLVFKGAIDDNSSDESKVKHHYLNDALNELTAGNEITVKTSKAFGCSIKRTK